MNKLSSKWKHKMGNISLFLGGKAGRLNRLNRTCGRESFLLHLLLGPRAEKERGKSSKPAECNPWTYFPAAVSSGNPWFSPKRRLRTRVSKLCPRFVGAQLAVSRPPCPSPHLIPFKPAGCCERETVSGASLRCQGRGRKRNPDRRLSAPHKMEQWCGHYLALGSLCPSTLTIPVRGKTPIVVEYQPAFVASQCAARPTTRALPLGSIARPP